MFIRLYKEITSFLLSVFESIKNNIISLFKFKKDRKLDDVEKNIIHPDVKPYQMLIFLVVFFFFKHQKN
jgi:hypothetical protein